MAEIVIPLAAIIMVCGPSCAGKTTLAQKIFQKSSQYDHLKFLYSVDRELPAAIAQTAGGSEYCRYSPDGELYLAPDLPPDLAKSLALTRSNRLAEALNAHSLMIYDGVQLSRQDLLRQLMAMSFNYGLWRPTILIKVLPKPKLHEAFYAERAKSQGASCYIPMKIIQQGGEFATQIMCYNFEAGWKLDTEFYEYAVTDPREVELFVE